MAKRTTSQVTNVRADAVRIQCPYCGYEGFYQVEDANKPFVVLCDIDDGSGCDRYFVASIRFWATVTTMAVVDAE